MFSLSTFLSIFTLGFHMEAQAGTVPGVKSLRQKLGKTQEEMDVVQNRFFLKQERFEIAPIAGTVPNNPMVNRYTGGVLIAYHFSESIAAEGAFIYSPDLGLTDIKNLTTTLVTIAYEGSNSSSFQQPLDKMELGATFAARWSPIYGKINLIGENILNFDFYSVAGLGMLSSNEYFAQYDSSIDPSFGPPVALVPQGRKLRVPLNVGVGMNFFLNQTIALKLDARSYLYYGLKPQYDPKVPVTESRVYNNFVTSAGISIFVPKMKPRIMNF